MEIKKKHHFVSQFYLKNWVSDDKKLYVWDGGNNIFTTTTDGIGYRKHFYKLERLKPKQIDYLHKFIYFCNFENLSTYKLIIKSILETEKVFHISEKLIEILDIKKNDHIEEFEEMDNLKKTFSNNIIEDKFSYDETVFSQTLSKIIKSDKGLNLTLKDYDTLIHFIAFQLGKTPQKFERITNDDGSDDRAKIFDNYDFTDKEFHTYTLYTILCLIEAIYLSCLSRLDKINIYYNNDPSINFITSDDPCFNQKINDKKLHIQVPISPKIMIELIENNDNNKDELLKYYNYNKNYSEYISANGQLINFFEITQDEIITLNKKILENKHQFVYMYCENDRNDLTSQ
ncbi:DUF4238 domain-containing protein [Acinetobacter pittii]|uniref:DUF4238 domain-containing protein n=1 Tax=Acinetobacter pittii TaxID=48296 RepID=UPI00301595D9